MKLDPYFIVLTKINFKWFKDLNINPDTIKFPEQMIRKKLLDTGLGNDFTLAVMLNSTSKYK